MTPPVSPQLPCPPLSSETFFEKLSSVLERESRFGRTRVELIGKSQSKPHPGICRILKRNWEGNLMLLQSYWLSKSRQKLRRPETLVFASQMPVFEHWECRNSWITIC